MKHDPYEWLIILRKILNKHLLSALFIVLEPIRIRLCQEARVFWDIPDDIYDHALIDGPAGNRLLCKLGFGEGNWMIDSCFDCKRNFCWTVFVQDFDYIVKDDRLIHVKNENEDYHNFHCARCIHYGVRIRNERYKVEMNEL